MRVTTYKSNGRPHSRLVPIRVPEWPDSWQRSAHEWLARALESRQPQQKREAASFAGRMHRLSLFSVQTAFKSAKA